MRLVHALVLRGCSSDALPFAVLVVLVLRARAAFQLPPYIAMQADAAAAATCAYRDVGDLWGARELVDAVRQGVEGTKRLLALDPVPQPPQVAAGIDAALEALALLRVPLAEPWPSASEARAAAAAASSSRSAQLSALLECLLAPSARVVRGGSKRPTGLTPTLQAVKELVGDMLGATDPSAPGEGNAVGEDALAACLCVAFMHDDGAWFESLAALAAEPRAAPSPDSAPEKAAAPLATVLQAVRELRTQHAAPAGAMSAAAEALADALERGAPALAEAWPEVLADAALELWATMQPLLDGVACASDMGSNAAALVLRAVHSALGAVDHPDAGLR